AFQLTVRRGSALRARTSTDNEWGARFSGVGRICVLIGIDWGGTKIEGVAMEPDGRELLRLRQDTPRHDYFGCIRMIKEMIDGLETQTGRSGSVGIGIPGSLEPVSRLGKGASSTW